VAGRETAVECPAKINLFLDVLGRRPDGYHDIATLFQTVSLCDTVVVALAGEAIAVESDDPALPADGENLAGRAARALLDEAGRGAARTGVRVRIAKRIPVGAGLGGGSADAAGVLVALERLLALGWPAERLEAVAAGVGSDVPFLVRGGTALGAGRGERLTRLPAIDPIPILLAKPQVAVPTRWAYDNLRGSLTHSNRVPTIAGARGGLTLDALVPLVWNAFEPLITQSHPSVRAVRDTMMAAGARAAGLSGTGPTVFGLFPDEAKLRSAQGDLESNGYWSARVSPVGERPLGA
jgi:4-diphosphocytidyl-2-C-methyl-D-erythritol kinase